MSRFAIHVEDGRVATLRQLAEVGALDASGHPRRPWHPIQGPSDASTMWYAVMRRRERGIFIGTLCFRHTGRAASLVGAGWEDVPVGAIGVGSASGSAAEPQAM